MSCFELRRGEQIVDESFHLRNASVENGALRRHVERSALFQERGVQAEKCFEVRPEDRGRPWP